MIRASKLALPALLALCAACGATPRQVAAPSRLDPARGAQGAAAQAGADVEPLPDHLGAWLDAFVAAFGAQYGEAYAFSGFLLVAQDGKPVVAKAYGKANRATGAHADGDTSFLIGSVTKELTAVAILQLAEKGQLRLSDPLRKYLPDYPAAGDRITIHQLLSHTSGIPNMKDDKLEDERDKPHAAKEIVASFSSKPLDFEPGTAFAYSNSNYFLLGLVLEKVTGETYGAYLQKHCFAPAGMTSTSLLDAPTGPNAAVGYARVDEQLVPARRVDVSLPFAAGALRSTAADLVRWDRALMGGVLLGAEWQKKMFTPVKQAAKEGYAYGMFNDALEGHAIHEHNGAIDGFSADVAGVDDLKLTVVGLSNNEGFDPDPIVDAAIRMAVTRRQIDPPHERVVVPLDAGTVARFVGDYVMDPASRKDAEGKMPPEFLASIQKMAFAPRSGGVAMTVGPQPPVQMFLGEDGLLFAKADGVTIQGEPAVPGKPAPTKSVVLRQGPFSLRWLRSQQKAN